MSGKLYSPSVTVGIEHSMGICRFR